MRKNYKDFETKTETAFKEAKEKATIEGLDRSLNKIYTQLLYEIQTEKHKELDKNKEEILHKLTEEIVKRYYYADGVYKQKVVFDSTISKAISLLNNTEKYHSILKK